MKIVDLSITLKTGMPVYEGDPEVKLTRTQTIATHTWELDLIEMGSHSGTHVDAFSHMDPNGETIDSIDLERFIVRASKNKLVGDATAILFEEEKTIDDYEFIIESGLTLVGGNVDVELERALLNHGVITLTNLINLNLLPEDEVFTLIALPLKLYQGNGSPVRAVAILNEGVI